MIQHLAGVVEDSSISVSYTHLIIEMLSVLHLFYGMAGTTDVSGIVMRFARIACIQVDTHQIELFFQIDVYKRQVLNSAYVHGSDSYVLFPDQVLTVNNR